MILGRLVDAAKNPIETASVTVNLPDNFNGIQHGFWAMTDKYGRYVLNQIPMRDGAVVLQTLEGKVVDGKSYARGRTEPFTLVGTQTVMDIVLPLGGSVMGRLIDENGNPITKGDVYLTGMSGQFEATFSSTGNGEFTIKNIPARPDYDLIVEGIPGRAPLSRGNVMVLPGEVTNLGALAVVDAVDFVGVIKGFKLFIEKVVPLWVGGEGPGCWIDLVTLNREFEFKDQILLDDKFQLAVSGQKDPNLKFASPPVDLKFVGRMNPGRNDFAAIFGREFGGGKYYAVFPAIKENIASQIGDITLPDVASWGSVVGTLKWIDPTNASNVVNLEADQAVILFYAKTATGLIPRYPTAIARPKNGEWLIERLPAGSYKVIALTRKFPKFQYVKGAQDWFDVTSLSPTATAPQQLDLVLRDAPAKIYGLVVDKNNAPVPNAKVNLNTDLNTLTNDLGVFEFYVPRSTTQFLANFTVSKIGISTVKVASTTSTLIKDWNMGSFAVSSDVGKTLKGYVIDKDTQKRITGAKVRLAYRQDAAEVGPLTVYGEQITDETGAFIFRSTPIGKRLELTARYFGYIPYNASTPAMIAGEERALDLLLGTNPLKANFLYADLYDDGYLVSEISLTRRVPVSEINIEVKASGTAITPDVYFLDEMDGLGREIGLEGQAQPTDVIEISVKHNTTEIGSYTIANKDDSSAESDIDPMAEGGVSGYLREEGGVQNIGLNIPEGVLPPDATKLQIKQTATSTANVLLADNTQADLESPIFEFDFGRDVGATDAKTVDPDDPTIAPEKKEELLKYAFDVTIKYVATSAQRLEPRWYDDTTKTWSTVGIVDNSIKWDTPSKGYVTFKVTHLTSFAIVKNAAATGGAGLRFDFNGDNLITTSDVVYMLAWIQTGRGTDKAAVDTRAKVILPSVTGSVVNLPSTSVDDINSDGVITTSDVVYGLAWIQIGRLSDTTQIETRAKVILPSVTGTVTNLPGATVNR
jgi:hypothetical protein